MRHFGVHLCISGSFCAVAANDTPPGARVWGVFFASFRGPLVHLGVHLRGCGERPSPWSMCLTVFFLFFPLGSISTGCRRFSSFSSFGTPWGLFNSNRFRFFYEGATSGPCHWEFVFSVVLSNLDRVSLMLIEIPFAFSPSEGCFGPVRALFSGRFKFCYRYRLGSFLSDEISEGKTSRSCRECPEASGIIYTAEFNNSAAELGLGFGRLDVLNSPEGPKGPFGPRGPARGPWVHWPTPGPRGSPGAQYKGPFHDMPISECRKSVERN